MGIYLENAVINGLEGQTPTGPFTKDGVTKERKFDALGFAYLMAIAHRQPDPGYKGQTDTICYADPQTLVGLTHLARPTLFNVRNFLVSLGLLSFNAEEVHKDVKGATKDTRYTNCYRIRLDKIRALFAPGVDGDKVWERDVLHINDNDRKTMSEAVWSALKLAPRNQRVSKGEKSVPQGDSTVPQGDSTVSTGESPVSTGDTNKNRTIKEQTNQQPPVDERVVEVIVREMAEAADVEAGSIDRKVVRGIIATKSLSAIQSVIRDFHATSEMKSPVATLVYRMKALVDRPANEPLDTAAILTPKAEKIDPLEPEWQKLHAYMGLGRYQSRFPEEYRSNKEIVFKWARCGYNPPHDVQHLQFLYGMLTESGLSASEFQARYPTIASRYEQLQAAMNASDKKLN